MGWGGSYGTAFANQGILTIPVYIEAGTVAFLCYVIGIAIAFFGAAIMTIMFGFKDIPEDADVEKSPKDTAKIVSDVSSENKHSGSLIKMSSPLEGDLVPLSQVNDEVFSSGAMGEGFAVNPKKGEIIAPMNCTVSVINPTLHAIGLLFDNGVEMLVHIGINTVKLKGEHFKAHVKAGDTITKGTKIISFDISGIEAKGYDVTTSVIVTNSSQYQEISVLEGKKASTQVELLLIKE
ncbi:PTS system beta-glucoside-specific EIIBCA component [compost metagenome]